MKKVAALITAALITSSLAAGCSNKNTALRNQYGASYGLNVPNQGSMLSQDYGTTSGIAYRDGIYTGQGDQTSNGNQYATVTVKNGRIVDVILSSLAAIGNNPSNLQGRSTAYSTTTPGMGTSQGYTAASNKNTSWYLGNYNTKNGIKTGGTNYGTTGYNYGMGNTTGYGTSTNYGNTTGYGPSTNYGNMTGYGTAPGTPGYTGNYYPGNSTAYGTGGYAGNNAAYGNTGSVGYSTSNTPNIAVKSEDQVKRDLVNAIIQRQSYDVNVSGGDPTKVNNWKLAIKRALDKARI